MAHPLSLSLSLSLSGMISLLSKELTFICSFVITAVDVVPCGGPKRSPRASSIVLIIFNFGPLRSAKLFWEF